MMKIEDIIDDIVLLVLSDHEPLKELGIEQNKLFAKVIGYDENGVWIENPDFRISEKSSEKVFREIYREKLKKISRNNFSEKSTTFSGFSTPLAGGAGPPPRTDILCSLSVRGGGPAPPASGVENPGNISEEFFREISPRIFPRNRPRKIPENLSEKVLGKIPRDIFSKIIFRIFGPQPTVGALRGRPCPKQRSFARSAD